MDFDRRTYLQRAAVATLAGVGLAGCLGGGSDSDGGTGTLATSVTDQPVDIQDFESLVVTVVGLWLGPADAESGSTSDDEETTDAENTTEDEDATEDEEAAEDEDDAEPSGREYHEFDTPQSANLVELQDESTQLIDERELETAEYQFLQLDTGEIDATLTDGSEATVETPGEAPLTFNESFEIRDETRTSFTADFTPVKRGQTGTYVLQPVAQGITVSYEDESAE